MKDIPKQDQDQASGGYRPDDGGCIPPFSDPIDYPQFPLVPFPGPLPTPTPDPNVFI